MALHSHCRSVARPPNASMSLIAVPVSAPVAAAPASRRQQQRQWRAAAGARRWARPHAVAAATATLRQQWRAAAAAGARRARQVSALAMRESPQNVPQPEAVPAPGLSAREALEAQLKAISCNNDPWPLHGLNVMYEYCYDSGSLERSRFFGFSKDIYHFDHWQGAMYSFAPELVNCERYEVDADGKAPPPPPPEELGLAPNADVAAFRVRVTPAGSGGGARAATAVFDFVLAVQTEGLRAGCWQTKRLLRVAAEDGDG